MSFHKNSSGSIDPSTLSKVRLTDLEWRACLYSTDCSETGLVLLRGSGWFVFYTVEHYVLMPPMTEEEPSLLKWGDPQRYLMGIFF